MKKCLLLFVATGIFCAVGSLHAQDISAVDSLFFKGVRLYEKGQYQNALEILELLDRIYPNHTRLTGSLLMQGKSLYKLQVYNRSLRLFGEIVKSYQRSEYYDDALYGIATVLYDQGLYKETVRQLMILVEHGGDKRLLRKAAKLSTTIMDYRLDVQLLRELLDEVEGEKGRAAVTLRLAQRELEGKHYQTAKRILQEFLDQYPESHYVIQIEQLLTEAEKKSRGLVKIGVILPLSGPYAEQGNDLLSGMQYAIDMHNRGDQADIELVIRDSKSQIIQAVKAAQELCEEEEIVALVGELEGGQTAAIAAIAQLKGVPLLSPTTSIDDLTSIGPMIFQLNASRAIQAEKIAEYAVAGLGLQRFAVLAPANEYGESMHRSFSETVARLGGEILTEQWYYEEGAEQLRPQFREIRKASILRMMEDSLIVYVPEEEWDDMYDEQPMLDGMLYVKKTVEELVDSTELAITSLDGVFLPVRGQDLQFVMPQFAYFNLETHIFGGSYWNQPELLEDNRDNIGGVYFISDYFIDPFNYTFTQFRDDYRVATQQSPERLDIIGYDTARLLLSVTGDQAVSREELKRRLEQIPPFAGLHGNVSFNEERVNHQLSLLQYLGGKVIKIK